MMVSRKDFICCSSSSLARPASCVRMERARPNTSVLKTLTGTMRMSRNESR